MHTRPHPNASDPRDLVRGGRWEQLSGEQRLLCADLMPLLLNWIAVLMAE